MSESPVHETFMLRVALLTVASLFEVRGQGIKLGRVSSSLPRREQPEVATRP